MSADTFIKLLFGMLLLLTSWSFIRREFSGELKRRIIHIGIISFRSNGMNIFYIGFILGLAVLSIGISELLP
jgi:hypothetical protein